MQNKKGNSKALNLVIIILLVVVLAVVCFSLYKYNYNNKSIENKSNTEEPSKSGDHEENEDNIVGTFKFNKDVKYEFKGNGKGSMQDGNAKYDYSYTIDEQKISMDFENELVQDATYSYKLENNILTLYGEEGTTGGEYTLEKENK